MTQLREPVIRYGVAFIPLSRSLEATVDLDDLHMIEGHNWHAIKAGGHAGHYAATWIDRKFTYMHRLILGDGGPHVDHIDGDGLNNRRVNLRPATPSQNGANSGPRGGTSDFKGVGWDKSRGLWVARIKVNHRPRWIGRFATEEEAARAYDVAAFDAWGDFAYLNFPRELVA